MRKYFLSIIIFLLFYATSLAQSKLGEVACVYVTSTNLDSSLAFYEKLGFLKTGSNIFPAPWAQASDGSLLIMIRKDNNPYIGLTYYVTNIEKVAEQLEKDGISFTQKPKEGDPIKRYYFKSPDGFDIMLATNVGAFQQPQGLTMLTMKQEDFQFIDKFPNKQCGVFGEFCHPVTDLNASITFWKKLGYEMKYQMNNPYPYAIMSDGLMLIGLHQTKHFTYPAITYFGLNPEKRIRELKEKGLTNFSDLAGKNNVVLKTWEGQHFFLFTFGM